VFFVSAALSDFLAQTDVEKWVAGQIGGVWAEDMRLLMKTMAKWWPGSQAGEGKE
jgi:hypothetical protein